MHRQIEVYSRDSGNDMLCNQYMSGKVQTSSGGLFKGSIKLRPKSKVPNSPCLLSLLSQR